MSALALPSAILTLTLAAPAGPPRPLPEAELSLHVRALEALPSLERFLSRAGQHAASMRPEPLAGLLHPLLTVEPGRPEAWAAQGLGPKTVLTASVQGPVAWSCVDGVEPQKLKEALDPRLAGLGTVTPLTARGATGKLASVEGQGQAGYLVQGKVACAAKGPGAGKLLSARAALLARPGKPGAVWSPALALEGDVLAVTPRGVAAVRAEQDTLALDLLTHALPLPALAGPGQSPYALPASPRLLTARARLSPAGIQDVLAQTRAQLRTLCPDCAVGPLLDAVQKELTGHVLVHVSNARPRNGLRSDVDRYFSVRHALLLEVKNPARFGSLWEQAAKWPGVTRRDDGVKLTLPGGTVEVVLRGKQLALANDAEALATALAAVAPAPTPLLHGAEWASDGPALGRALGSVSLFDVMAEPSLAPLLGAALEFRPLLLATTGLRGTVDGPGGQGQPPAKGAGHRVRARWTLGEAAR